MKKKLGKYFLVSSMAAAFLTGSVMIYSGFAKSMNNSCAQKEYNASDNETILDEEVPLAAKGPKKTTKNDGYNFNKANFDDNSFVSFQTNVGDGSFDDNSICLTGFNLHKKATILAVTSTVPDNPNGEMIDIPDEEVPL